MSASMSVCRYWLTLISGLLECLCFAGVMFGWASLVFVLKSDHYFGYLCVNNTINGTDITDCSEQDEQLSTIFTVASSANNFFMLPIGFLFDHFGTTVIRLLGISLYTIGTLLIAFSSAALSVLLYPALTLIAIGGLIFLVTNMQVGNLFGAHRSTVITVYNGAFDSSSAVFFVIKLLYQTGVSFHHSFIVLSCCSMIHLIRTFLLMPLKHIPYPLPENYIYGLNCWKSHTSTETEDGNFQTSQEEKALLAGRKSSPLSTPTKPKRSFRSCIFSWFFLWHVLWLSIMQLRHLLFIGTLNPMLYHLAAGDHHLVSSYTNAFAFTQLCGILCAPWNGLIMDRHKGKNREKGEPDSEADLKATILSLFLTVVQCLLFSLCATVPLLPLQYLTFVLQVVNRSFLYGGNAAFLSVAFPSEHFGKLYGTVLALSAFAALLQYPCFSLISGPLHGNPSVVNIALTVLICVTFIHPLYVYLHCRRQTAARTQANINTTSTSTSTSSTL